MNNRIEAAREELRENHLEALMVTKPENRRYLSGFAGTAGILVLTDRENYLITDFRYIDQAAEEALGFQVVRASALPEDALAELILKLGIKRLGFEEDSLTYRQYCDYKNKLAGVELIALNTPVEKIRWVKDSEEVEAIRQAARITDEAYDYIWDFIRPGVRESELALEIEYYMKKRGAQKSAFDVIVASGPRGALPHGVASGKELAAGELVVMDFGAVFSGYHADMTRTVILGEPDRQQAEIYQLVLEAQEKAIRLIKPGLKCSQIDLAARDLITTRGYGANFGHSLGHSVGLEIHEKPGLATRDDTLLEPGMVLTVEPGVYLSGWGGVRIEDLVLVTPEGCEVLSRSPKQLRECIKE